MEIPRILKYEGEVLSQKDAFSKIEMGIIGLFHENWESPHEGCLVKLRNKNNVIVFAPNQEDFDYSLDKTTSFKNHRFLNCLRWQLGSLRENKDVLNPKKRFYSGGKVAEYYFIKNFLVVSPYYHSSGREDSKLIAKLIASEKKFQVESFKVIE
ncbi:MAG: hypothetical protein NUV46_03815 [Nanoarchaeota archaeon]|nr:hypothetical protein [Nanoarchaeota archaeon]